MIRKQEGRWWLPGRLALLLGPWCLALFGEPPPVVPARATHALAGQIGSKEGGPSGASDKDGRAPVPGEARQRTALDAVRAIYGDRFESLKTREERIALARELIEMGQKTEDDAAGRYALFDVARKVAVRSGDLETALAAVDQTARHFAIDAWKARVDVVRAVAETRQQGADAKSARQALALAPLKLIRQAIDEKQFDAAGELAEIAGKAAATLGQDTGTFRDRVLRRRVEEQLKRLTEEMASARAAYERIQRAMAKLEKTPDDAEANLIVGKHLIVAKDEWPKGVSYLALGADAELRDLAARELAAPADAKGQASLGDGWWDKAEKATGQEKKVFRLRAVYWYRKASGGLTGLVKVKVQKRLGELGEVGPGAAAGTAATGDAQALDCRSQPARANLVQAMGGNEQSEKAVAAALEWLAEHQLPDGGWSFNHAIAPKCRGQCGNPGTENGARNAATGLALSAFLGAGQTHKAGKYKANVKAGLYFLVNRMQVSPKGGSLYDKDRGRMYAHGIASIALCEAYAMTRDKGLYGPAQQAINFICYAQDPVGGGWRYQPRQKGDTSVSGWQILALKNGHMAYLRVPAVTVKKAFQFLDVVQSNGGANYGYVDPGAGQATTAIGLLCRMYLGWKKDNPALVRGVKWLGAQGPSKGNMYYNYYATQVMRHVEGEEWVKWNKVMRDQLVKSQATDGHEQGSWHMGRGDHGASIGGRLYCTALAALVLEAYYRYPSLYQDPPPRPD